MWFAAMLIPALVILGAHLLLLATCQRIAIRRVHRRVNDALVQGDSPELGKAATVAAEAARDWPSFELWELRKALELMQHRAAHGA